jgi:hypothetical protein
VIAGGLIMPEPKREPPKRSILDKVRRAFDPDADFGRGDPKPCAVCGRVRRDIGEIAPGLCERCALAVW